MILIYGLKLHENKTILSLQKKTMLDKLMSQMGPMKEAMEQTKKKLDTITVKGDADGDQIVVYVNGNRRVTEIKN